MIKRIMKWHNRRRRAMRIGMAWIEAEESVVKAVMDMKSLFSFDKGGWVGKKRPPEAPIYYNPSDWTGRP